MSIQDCPGPARELRLSPWLAKILLQKSPKHAYEATTNRDSNESSDSQRLGKAVDRLVFGTGDEIVIKTKRGEKEQRGQILVSESEFDQAKKVAAAVVSYAPGLCGTGRPQEKLRWESCGVICSGRPDHIDDDYCQVTDLKTAHDLSDDAVVKAIELYGYDIQAAAYLEAANHLFRWVQPPSFRFVFVETAAPYDVRIIEPGPDMLQSGAKLWNQAKATWKRCLASGEWPGRGNATLSNSRYRRNKDTDKWMES